ncbi:hypothetical protein D9M71_741480 [compost metagenome]
MGHGIVAIDGLQLQTNLGNGHRVAAVNGGFSREDDLQRLVLSSRLAYEGQRIRAKGTYRVSVDPGVGMFKCSGELEVAEAPVWRSILNQGEQGLAGGDGVLKVLRAAGVPHHVL